MLKLILAILVTSISSVAYAQQDDFLITVYNETPYDCQLDDAHAIKGYEMSVLRPLIHSGEKANFVVSHPLSNAKYDISYQCGNDEVGFKRITFMSKQNFSFFWAGYVSGQVIPDKSDSNITAIITDKGRGSVTFYMNGHINWSIRYKQ